MELTYCFFFKINSFMVSGVVVVWREDGADILVF